MEIQTRGTFRSALLIRDPDTGVVGMLPDPIDVTIIDAPWDVTFRMRTDPDTRAPYIDELLIRRHRDGGEPISAGVVRGLKLGEAMKLAVEQASMRVEEVGDGVLSIAPTTEMAPGRLSALAFKRERKITVTNDDYRRAARAYAETRSITKAAKKISQSRTTTHRWIKKAEELGLNIAAEEP